jgi:4-diphosphocytidyl-2-C-methyl-D-erythritol kinase
MYVKAYAKINMSLDVIGKREDGYHMLKMIMQTIELYDLIKVIKTDSGIKLSCNKEYLPVDDRNIAYKAARLFLDYYKIDGGVEIFIEKNIPVAAGLAGGSTDAAAVLKCMKKLYRQETTLDEMKKLALKLGADVPYCLTGGTALCEGIGEIVTPLKPFRNRILVLVKPPFGVSTKEVYSNLKIDMINIHPYTEGLLSAVERNDLKYVAHHMRNVLENVTIKKNPVLKNIKLDMMKMGAQGSIMSGSGPTVFGFFDDMLKAQRCFESFKSKYKEVYITRTI